MCDIHLFLGEIASHFDECTSTALEQLFDVKQDKEICWVGSVLQEHFMYHSSLLAAGGGGPKKPGFQPGKGIWLRGSLALVEVSAAFDGDAYERVHWRENSRRALASCLGLGLGSPIGCVCLQSEPSSRL